MKRVASQWPGGNPGPVSLVFLGEAPDEEEVDRGKPFVGPSGRVFNAALRIADLDREQALVTNVFDIKAPDNDVGDWLRDKAFHQPHLDRLGEELRLAAPTVIVPLGATALWALTGQTAIGSYRGTVMKASRLVPGTKLVPTFHPAMVIKSWKMLPVMVGDITKAAREVERGPKVYLPRRRLVLEPTLEDVHAFTLQAEKAPLVSLDIETGWGQITSFGIAQSEELAISIPFVDLRRPNRSYWRTAEEETEAWKHIRRLCEAPVPKLGQNFTYDAFWLMDARGISVRNYLHDTRLMHHALYAELPKSLEFLGAAYSEQGAWKRMGMRLSKEKRDD